jgi:hypothetical protein
MDELLANKRAGEVADRFHLHRSGPFVALGLYKHHVAWPDADDIEDAE